MYKISYGLYIIGSKKEDSINGQTANTVVQISADPVSVAVVINKKNLTHEYIQAEKYFTISILEQETPLALIGAFGFKSGREADKFAGVNFSTTSKGLPYVNDHTLAYLEAEVTGEMDAGTHTIFLGRVTGAEVLKDGEPITYAYYHQVKRGTTPAAAPTHMAIDRERGTVNMDKYVCTLCGYIYDPEEGDPENNISPGTSFAELPDDWVCPVCGANKDEFEKES